MGNMVQPYSVIHPKGDQIALLFNSPHSGTYLPEHFLHQISVAPDLLHHSGDLMVDELIRDTPLFGATAFINHYARTYVDTNRSAREIDPDMFLPPKPDQKSSFEETQKVIRGFGIFSRKSYNGQEIYRGKLPFAEIAHRLNLVYHPVHTALGNLLEQFHQKHGFYILIDCHSMPSYHFIDPGLSNAKQPDLIIGNCYDTSCCQQLTPIVADYFTKHGLKVAFNSPYSGGFNTQHYGCPLENRNTLQLEFNRAIYMNEMTIKPHEGFSTLQLLLTGLSEKLAQDISGFFPSEKSL